MRRFPFTLLSVLAVSVFLSMAVPAQAFQWGRFGYGGPRSYGGYGYYSPGYYSGYYSGYSPGYGYGYGRHHWGGYYPGYGYGSYTPGYGYGNYTPGYAYAPSYNVPSTYAYVPPIVTDSSIVRVPTPSRSTSMYYAPPAQDNMARLRVLVPADAQVWVDGYLTTKTGATREFTSPALDPSREFTYEVKARWMKEGAPVEQTRQVKVRANQTTNVDFGIVPERDK